MNWSYIAGFFDGEGSISPNGGGFRVSIPQTNKKVLEEILHFTKVGFVINVKKRQAHWKDSWVYYIASKKDVYYFLSKTMPFLIVKKENTLNAMHILKNQIYIMEKKIEIHNKRKREAKIMKLKGLSYRQIGKELKIDWGYARRLILDLA
ncbi:MAG: hypothetical protein A3D35_03065 [Candidatus Staskawiczbacteria bacterium RIFCSPHIGHO2_02_FULL_34_9]|uniref:Homing endonuclease LAGLIDADG domain-containing protein n=1 Tax=Candidatus Staskawiczbacteria bacterium RIFCSPHIGHO2_02_FULL_34_9 TaxID=1802206 RepID=A0A1G2I326_9BACT|nr:MAG: hypothetical protein A3D35_03065 [Candidatus Staskawiczbacteria bacterium RIFCSPHIGHO2_02_FULL_34_9]